MFHLRFTITILERDTGASLSHFIDEESKLSEVGSDTDKMWTEFSPSNLNTGLVAGSCLWDSPNGTVGGLSGVLRVVLCTVQPWAWWWILRFRQMGIGHWRLRQISGDIRHSQAPVYFPGLVVRWLVDPVKQWTCHPALCCFQGHSSEWGPESLPCLSFSRFRGSKVSGKCGQAVSPLGGGRGWGRWKGSFCTHRHPLLLSS